MNESMYSLNKIYKFTLKGKTFYTGEVIVESPTHIKIRTIKKEEPIVAKDLIERAIPEEDE